MMVVRKHTRSTGHVGVSAAVRPTHSRRVRSAGQELDDTQGRGVHRNRLKVGLRLM